MPEFWLTYAAWVVSRSAPGLSWVTTGIGNCDSVCMSDPATRRSTPRPVPDSVCRVRRDEAAHHVWGDAESGLVSDRVISSTDQLHVLEFQLTSGTGFRHSATNPTVFAADVVYACLEGELTLADPETGEVVIAQAGSAIAFGRDTWHHGFATAAGTTTVLEFMSPPPSRGTASTYAQRQPLLQASRYADTRWAGHWPEARAERAATSRLHHLTLDSALLSFAQSSPAHLLRTLVDHDLLRVVHGTLAPGSVEDFRPVDRESVLRVLTGEIWVDTHDPATGTYTVLSLTTGDHAFLPLGIQARLLERAGHGATYLLGSARVPSDWAP